MLEKAKQDPYWWIANNKKVTKKALDTLIQNGLFSFKVNDSTDN